MARIHNLGFPRIGAKRELKFALESFWQGNSSTADLLQQAAEIRQLNWQQQKHCDWVPAGDFSLYDHVLDTSFLLGNLPARASSLPDTGLDRYFRLARGRSAKGDTHPIQAGEMTKWFDTNYHYIVPEISQDTEFQLNPAHLLAPVQEALAVGVPVKPVVIGPVTYLWLSKTKDGSSPLDALDKLLPLYIELLQLLDEAGVEWLQIDEPALVTALSPAWQQAFEQVYQTLADKGPKLLLATYFGTLGDNLPLVSKLPVAGFHLDAINAREEVDALIQLLPDNSVLSLGVINGRNIWKTDLSTTLDWLEPIAERLQDRLWLAPSCSLLHVPVDLDNERKLDPEIHNWLAFAKQKLQELSILKTALNQGRQAVAKALSDNLDALQNRRQSKRVHNPQVQAAMAAVTTQTGIRNSPYALRATLQRDRLQLPLLPTTTIGSFPQTPAIRALRLAHKKGTLDQVDYETNIRQEIAHAVDQQEKLGLDVLVHGEAERNDMVEYFGEQLEGYAFSQFGWVQSYGSRCVKPPILFGDVSRPKPITLKWTQYAQSLTQKPMKGMLTGPVTLLNWSFVRDDQPRKDTCLQLALAVREEVQDLEAAGIQIIQIDEAALREGLPLRKSDWHSYLDWAVAAFRVCAGGVNDATQIHTHMCYSEFNDIIAAIADMDADVITIETSRSDMELLDSFDQFNYPNEIGPGVYDIHSPNTPDTAQIVDLMTKAAQRIHVSRLWVNPDCGLKTRQWDEVNPALANMVAAAQQLRAQLIR